MTTASPSAAAPSFVRGLFAGEIADELLFPYPAPLDARKPDEAETVRQLLAAFDAMVKSGLVDPVRHDIEATIPESVISAFAEAGLLGISIPVQYGGLGLSYSAYARVFGAIASVDPSLGVLLGVHCGLGSKALALYGTPAQCRRFLPGLARGEMLAAYALTEPETGSDARHIVTRAERTDGGWLLRGRKHWIGNGHRAGMLVVFAQTRVERRGEQVLRPTAFIVTPDQRGFRVLGTIDKLGIRGSTQAELLFEDVFVADDMVLGEVGGGFAVAVHALNAGRLSLAAGCAQAAKALVGEMLRYGGERVQFGKPLIDFALPQHRVAMLAAESYAADAMVGHLAAALDAPDSDVALEAACAKVFASELIWRAVDDMVQLAGGRGYVRPWPYERMLRDARINRIFEGANEVLRLFIGLTGVQTPAEELAAVGHALTAPFEQWPDHWVLLTEYAAERVKTAFGARDRVSAPLPSVLATHVKFLEQHVAECKVATDRAITTHRRGILEAQVSIDRLAGMAIELYARATTIARTAQLVEANGVDACATELALCELFCVESGRRFRTLRQLLCGATCEATDRLALDTAARLRAADGYRVSDAVLDVPAPHVRPPVPVLLPATGRPDLTPSANRA
jgi:alkylation response protein AidB-like acyl-CoA dehydrogenase